MTCLQTSLSSAKFHLTGRALCEQHGKVTDANRYPIARPIARVRSFYTPFSFVETLGKVRMHAGTWTWLFSCVEGEEQ